MAGVEPVLQVDDVLHEVGLGLEALLERHLRHESLGGLVARARHRVELLRQERVGFGLGLGVWLCG